MSRSFPPLIALLAALAVPLPATGQSDAVTLTWRSTPDDPVAQTREVTNLYLALYNSRSLPTQVVENPDGTFVEPLLFREKALIGRGLAPAVDAILCDLNADICTRERTALPEARLEDLTAHVGGYRVSPAQWRFSPGDSIRIPALDFETFTTLRSQRVEPGWSPETFAAAPGLDCSAWGVSCGELVAGLNPPIFRQSTTRSASVPVTGHSTEIELGYDAGSKYSEALDARRIVKDAPIPAEIAWSEAYARFAETAPLTDLALKALGSNVILVGDVKKFAIEDETLFDVQVELLSLIHHPFAKGQELGPLFRHPVSVLVLDTPFDAAHCDIAVEGAEPAGAGSGAETCGEIAEVPNPVNDHAPHIIALINAPLNGKGMVGINPFSTVRFDPIDTAFSAEEDLTDAQIKLQSGALRDIRIANLSWGFPSLNDSLNVVASAVEAINKKTLIVAAAGNAGEQLGEGTAQGCPWIPACLFDLPNVITVVGVDRTLDAPKLWTAGEEGSNWAIRKEDDAWLPAFHIAGVAEGVLSAVRNNRFGRLSGTSQAAPQVAATASLIISAAEDLYPELSAGPAQLRPRLAPKVVKDRLIYSSDLFRGLQNEIFGGRLNVERAINIVETQLVLSTAEGTARTVSGRLIEEPNGSLVVCSGPDGGSPAQYQWSSVRRMHWDAERKEYVIFYHAAPSGDASNRNDFALKRIVDCDLSSRSNRARLVTAENEEVIFTLKDILDYTSPLLP